MGQDFGAVPKLRILKQDRSQAPKIPSPMGLPDGFMVGP